MCATLFSNLGNEIRHNDNNLFTRTARKTSGASTVVARNVLLSYSAPVIFRRLMWIGADEAGSLDSRNLCPSFMTTLSERRRSVAFIEKKGESWACFLVTFVTPEGLWHGYFSFRPGHGEAEEDEVRTADIFIEDSEAEIHHKARGLGKPLLSGLLDSALHTRRANGMGGPKLRGRFRALLKENAQEIAGDWAMDGVSPPGPEELERLRSLYTSYRLDQVSHFICLVDPADFESTVDEILAGESIDFRSKDRVQFAMMVVDHIERMLPLPDFETWAQDFLAHREAYRLYTHTLHREGRLP